MVLKLKKFNLALRGGMELGIVAGLAYWGAITGHTPGMKLLLTVGAPLFLFGFWGLIDFRQAGRLAEPLRLIQELVISAVAVLACYVSGAHVMGLALGLLSLMHHMLVYLLGGRLLKT